MVDNIDNDDSAKARQARRAARKGVDKAANKMPGAPSDAGKKVEAASKNVKDKSREASQQGVTGDKALDDSTAKRRKKDAVKAGAKQGKKDGKELGKAALGEAGAEAGKRAAQAAAIESGPAGMAAAGKAGEVLGRKAGRIKGARIGKKSGKSLGKMTAKREHKKAEEERTGKKSAGPLKKIILTTGLLVILPWFFMAAAATAIVGTFAYVILDNKLGEMVTGLACTADSLNPFGGDSPICSARSRILEALDNQPGLKNKIESAYGDDFRFALDCTNVPSSSRAEGMCIEGLLSNPEDDLSPIPERAAWLVPIYKKAAQKYDLPWELIAGIHGARTNFGLRNCYNRSRDDDGYYRFPRGAVAGQGVLRRPLQVDGGEAQTGRELGGKGCYETSPPPSFKPDKRISLYDAVDATFTEGNILSQMGAKGEKWDYKGSPLTAIGFDKKDGPVYMPPSAASGGACAGIDPAWKKVMTANQINFVRALAEKSGISSLFIAAWVLSEMSGSAAAARESERYYNWLNIGIPGGRAAPAQLKIWNNPESAARATLEFFDGSGQIKPSSGIKAAMAKIKKSGASDLQEAARILGESGWAASKYGSPAGANIVKVANTTLGGKNAQCAASTTAQDGSSSGSVASAAQYSKSRTGTVAFAIASPNGSIIDGRNENKTFYGASLSKAMVMVAVMRKNERLSPQQRSLLSAMIKDSNNDAANTLYGQVGAKSVRGVARAAGMRNFSLREKTSAYHLGGSRLTAADQARFFAKVLTITPANHRQTAKKLMSQVRGVGKFGVLDKGAYGKSGWNAAEGVAHSGGNKSGNGIAIMVGSSNKGDKYNMATNTGVAKRLLKSRSSSSQNTTSGTSSSRSTTVSGGKSMGSFEASAYGPPWGGIEGGVFGDRCSNTSTGVKLCKDEQKLAIAVNPSVIPYGTKVKINPNPFKDANLVFTAVDTGGYGNSVPRWVDFFVASGRSDQNKWGRKQVKVYKVGKGSPKDVATLGEGGSQSSGAATLPFTKSCKYEGKPQTDPISRAVAWRTGDSRYSRCYVAAINGWYKAIVADPEPGGSGNIDAGGPVRAAIVKIALREAKLSNKWPSHANNCGPPKTRYFPGSEWPCGTPWCALFTTWVWKKAGVNFTGSASVSSLSIWGKEKKLYKSGPHNNPQPGDMVMKNGSHVALVTKVTSPHNIDTVGGNEGVDNVVLQKGYNPTARGWTHYVSPPGPSSTSETGSLAWPLAGEVTLEFGKRRAVGRTTGPRNNGINIKTDPGTNVKAAAAGKVTLASEVRGLGNYVCIMHPQFGLTSCYAYNDKVTVSTGDSVKKGQVIGKSGAILHFEVREGLNPGDKAVDPQKYLKKR